jgi:hypothetical protein
MTFSCILFFQYSGVTSHLCFPHHISSANSFLYSARLGFAAGRRANHSYSPHPIYIRKTPLSYATPTDLVSVYVPKWKVLHV